MWPRKKRSLQVGRRRDARRGSLELGHQDASFVFCPLTISHASLSLEATDARDRTDTYLHWANTVMLMNGDGDDNAGDERDADDHGE